MTKVTNTQIAAYPSKLSMGFSGYYNHMDKTLLPINVLTAPTKNCFMPSRDKVEVRKGSKLLGQEFEYNFGINGHYKKYVNKAGLSFEIRTGPISFGAQVYDALYNKRVLNTNTNEYEYIPTWVNFYSNPSGTILPNINNGGVRVYFTEVWDNTRKQPRLVWTDGFAIRSWSGGIAVIETVVGTTITIKPEYGYNTWAGAGFDGGIDVGGNQYIVVNGNPRQIVGGSLSTNSITLLDATGIAPGDIAADYINTQTPIHANILASDLHYARAIKNHVVYGNFYSREEYGSNALNVDSLVTKTSSNAVQDDLIIANGNQYDGTDYETVKLVISSVSQLPERTFTPADPTTSSEFIDNLVFSGEPVSLTRTHIDVIVTGPGPTQPTDVYVNGILTLSTTLAALANNPTPVGTTGISIYVGANVLQWDGTNGSVWTYEYGGVDKYDFYVNDVLITAQIDASTPTTYKGVTFSFAVPTGHTLGDTWTVTLEPAIEYAWADFYYSVPIRKPGQGFKFNLPSNFWSMGVQEDVMYIADARGGWSYLELILSADLLSESVIVQPLKQENASKPIFPYMLGYLDNAIMYVTEDKKLDGISRKKFLQLPQIGYLSDPVKLDFEALSFIGGSIEYQDKKLWITSPQSLTMLCYDNVRKYWQPPQEIPENGILSISLVYDAIGKNWIEYLISHSNIRNQTNILFIGTNDNGSAFQVRMRTGYLSYGNRWMSKEYNMTFIEGYMPSLFDITFTVLNGIEGSEGTFDHVIVPKFFQPKNNAVLGGGPLGSHSLGSANPNNNPYFREIYPAPMEDCYFHALDLTCDDLDQTWSLIALGTNAVASRSGNDQLKNSPILIT